MTKFLVLVLSRNRPVFCSSTVVAVTVVVVSAKDFLLFAAANFNEAEDLTSYSPTAQAQQFERPIPPKPLVKQRLKKNLPADLVSHSVI